MTKKELADLLENFATDILNGVVENTDEMQVLTEKLASIIIEGFSNNQQISSVVLSSIG